MEEKINMLKTAKKKQDNFHKMKLTDVEAFKLKFSRKKKTTIDLCEKMVLSGFDSKANFDLQNINAPIFCYSNNQLVAATIKMIMEIKPEGVSELTIKDFCYTVAINYNIVPYHNFTHAFSVAQVSLLSNIKFQRCSITCGRQVQLYETL